MNNKRPPAPQRVRAQLTSRSKKRAFKSIDEIVVEPQIGQIYGVAWAKDSGTRGLCVGVNMTKKIVFMESPLSRMPWKNPVKFIDLIKITK